MTPTIGSGARIVFAGDSITDASWQRDDQQLLGYGFVRLVAGLLGSRYPHAGFTFVNRGVSASTVADVKERWEREVLAESPDLISVLVGINESHHRFLYGTPIPHESFVADYRAILTAARRRNPEVRFVLIEPFVTVITPALLEWEAELMARVVAVRRLAEEFGAALVGANSLFAAASAADGPLHWAWDGIHPTVSGHQLLADAWLGAVRIDPAVR